MQEQVQKLHGNLCENSLILIYYLNFYVKYNIIFYINSRKRFENMRKRNKMITLFLAIIIVGLAILWRIIFVCNGDEIKNIVYKSDNLIIHEVKHGSRNLIILGTGYSVSIDEKNKIVNHDPFMIMSDMEFGDETVLSIYYPFESAGLEVAGEELSDYINSVSNEYDSITLVGHSKCGVCFANAVKWINDTKINIVTVSAPFLGTPIADTKAMTETLNQAQRLLYKIIFSNHKVDQDIMIGSEFIISADYSGLEKCAMHINIVSKCPEKNSNLLDCLLKYLDEVAMIRGDGIVPKSSQQGINYENTIEIVIEATHASSLQKGWEIAEELVKSK